MQYREIQADYDAAVGFTPRPDARGGRKTPLLPYSLSPRGIGDLSDVRRRVSAIADLLVRGLQPAS